MPVDQEVSDKLWERARELSKLEPNLLLGYIAAMLEAQPFQTQALLNAFEALGRVLTGFGPPGEGGGWGVVVRGTVRVQNAKSMTGDYGETEPLDVYVTNSR